jgi:hypothetical protein
MIEVMRKIKTQPEIIVDWLRLYASAHATIRIHEVLATGMNVEGWSFDENGHAVPQT